MQIVSLRDNLHEMSKPIFWENKKNIMSLLSAELDQRVVKLNDVPDLKDIFVFIFRFNCYYWKP